MTILIDVPTELFGMFVADARLTAAILTVVSVSAVMIDALGVAPRWGGLFLLVGCLLVLIGAVVRFARARAVR